MIVLTHITSVYPNGSAAPASAALDLTTGAGRLKDFCCLMVDELMIVGRMGLPETMLIQTMALQVALERGTGAGTVALGRATRDLFYIRGRK